MKFRIVDIWEDFYDYDDPDTFLFDDSRYAIPSQLFDSLEDLVGTVGHRCGFPDDLDYYTFDSSGDCLLCKGDDEESRIDENGEEFLCYVDRGIRVNVVESEHQLTADEARSLGLSVDFE
jgi:hypothetical protein